MSMRSKNDRGHVEDPVSPASVATDTRQALEARLLAGDSAGAWWLIEGASVVASNRPEC